LILSKRIEEVDVKIHENKEKKGGGKMVLFFYVCVL